eukprot:510459_1
MSKSKKKHSSKKTQSKDKEKGAQQVETTLHGYPMTGPFTVSQKTGAVWYCDNKKCTYTQHGVYRRYNIQNWRSTKFGKKFTLCDGCVRQYKRKPKIEPQKSASNVNVKVNISGVNPSYQSMQMQPGAYVPMQQQYYNPQYPMQQQPMVNMNMQQPMYNPQYPMQQQQPPQAYNFQQPQQPMMPMQQQYAQPQPQPQPIVPQQPPMPLEEKENVQLDNNNEKIITNGVVKQGWMMKKGDLIKSWKKRYFVLKSNKILNYYESDNAVMVKGTCKLDKVKSVKTKSDQSFEVDTPKRKWCFACKDAKTRDAWVNKIKSVAGI